RVRLSPAAQAFDPVRHMREVVVADESWRDGVAPGQRDVFLGALNQRVVFARALLFDPFPARTPFAAHVDERGGFSHDPRETVAVVAEAGGITYQKAFRVFQQRLERVRVLASVLPGEDAAGRHHGFWKRIVEKIVNQVNPVAHPLIRDAAGKIFVEAELEVHSRIKRPGRFFEQPAKPVRILFPNFADFRTTAPAWAVIVPTHLYLADLPERDGLDKVGDGDLIGFAAVLRSDRGVAFVFE